MTWAQAASRSWTRVCARRSAAASSGSVVVTWQQALTWVSGNSLSLYCPRLLDPPSAGAGRQSPGRGATFPIIQRRHHRPPAALELDGEQKPLGIGSDSDDVR